MPSMRHTSQDNVAHSGQIHDMETGEVSQMDENDPTWVWSTEDMDEYDDGNEEVARETSERGAVSEGEISSDTAMAFDRSHKASVPSGRVKEPRPAGWKTRRGHLHDGSTGGIYYVYVYNWGVCRCNFMYTRGRPTLRTSERAHTTSHPPHSPLSIPRLDQGLTKP